jgi:hypothetical protein
MTALPRSLPEFEARFPDEAACARWLLTKRWPDGFRCPARGHDEAWELGRERLTLQCAACERQVSVTAGTVLHGSHLGLRTWFLAAWLMATHADGVSARQLWKQLGLGSYESAWLLVRKLRRAMVDPAREPLAGLVEVDESGPPSRAKDAPVRPGRSRDGKLPIAGAVEVEVEVEGRPGRIRLAMIGDSSAAALGGRARRLRRRRRRGRWHGGTVVSGGRSGSRRPKGVEHDPKVIGGTPAHPVLPWVRRVFANAKRWALGVCHGPRPAHLQADPGLGPAKPDPGLDELVFRFDRRRSPSAAFDRLLGLSLTFPPATYQMLVGRS